MAKKKTQKKTEKNIKKNIKKNRITVRYSDIELRKLKTSADKAEKTISEYLRARSTGRRIQTNTPELNREAYVELTKLSSNINQLTNHLENGLIKNVDGNNLKNALRLTYRIVRDLRSDLKIKGIEK